MVDIIKYDMTNIWASAGDVVAPDAAKINAGWGVEVVPRQWWNWFENRQDNNIAYMLQKGFPEWDATTQYIINKSYVQRNGIVYKATATSTNSDPVNLTSWVRAFTDYTVANAALGTVTPAADRLPYFNGASTATFTTLTAFARTLLDDTTNTAARTTLGAQASHTNLTALSGVTAAANALPYFTSTTAMGVATLTAFGRSLMDDNDAAEARTTLGLGTAATSTVTTSPTDTTAGRLLKVGDFGLGATTSTAAALDCNTITATGIYGISSGTANGPVGATSGSMLIASVYSSAEQRQIVLYRTNPPRMSIRSQVTGIWSDWEELWTTAALTKTTTSTDTTAGSMLRVGDFGLGSSTAMPPTIADLTANIPVGFYFVGGSTPGAPTTLSGYLTVTTFSHCTFVIATTNITTRKIWDGVRSSTTGAWTWTELVHDGNLAAITSSITSDVTSNVQASIDLKQNISTLAVETSGSAEDPNTSLNTHFLTNHVNGPQANGGINGFYHIQQQFYQSKADNNRSRSQIAITYNTTTPQMWIRSGYTATPGSVAPTWYPWVRCDMGGTAATATALATPRTINGVSFNGTANINVPVYAAPGAVSEIGKYLDFHETGSVADADVRLMSVPAGGTAPAIGYTGAGLAVGVGTSAGNGSVYASQFVTSGGWFRSNGALGWYNETYQGGIYMTDSTWVRTYNGKGFHADGGLSTSGNLSVSGVITGNGSGITNVVSVPTEIVRNSSIVEFSGIYLTGANVSTCDVPDPYVMVGMRTGANGPHGWAWLRATTFRTRA